MSVIEGKYKTRMTINFYNEWCDVGVNPIQTFAAVVVKEFIETGQMIDPSFGLWLSIGRIVPYIFDKPA